MKERINHSLPVMRKPGLLFRSMAADFWASRDLAWRLARRNLDALYRRSILGYLWLVIPPLVTAGIFIALKAEGVVSDPSAEVPYAAYILFGILLWQCFADGFQSPLRMLRQCASILPKLRIPGEALLMAAFIDSLIQAGIRMMIIALLLVVFGISPSANVLLFPVALIALVFVGFSFGILLAPFAVLLEDLERAAILLLPLWMLVSGVVVAAPQTGVIGRILTWNPVLPALSWARDCVLATSSSHIGASAAIVGICALMSLFAWILYRIALPHLIARIPV